MYGTIDADMVRRVSERDRKAEQLFYDNSYSYFKRNVSALPMVMEHVRDDIFQDSFLIIWTEIQNGKIFVKDGSVWRIRRGGNAAKMACSLNTFLLSIARNLILKHLAHEGPAMLVDIDDPKFYRLEDDDSEDVHEKESKNQVVDELLNDLPPRCKEILTLFYVKGFSLDKIMMLRKDKNTSKDGLKSGKTKCLAKLKENAKRRMAYV